MADGVASAIFSRDWADILTGAVVAKPPEVNKPSFWPWLAERAQTWHERILPKQLDYFQRKKLVQCGGAYATLLWVELDAPTVSAAGNPQYPWRSYAIGDSGLLHVRGNEVLVTFPVSSAEELAADPLSICSVDHDIDHLLEFRCVEGICAPGDLLVLCTDALLGWALRELAAGAAASLGDYLALRHNRLAGLDHRLAQ